MDTNETSARSPFAPIAVVVAIFLVGLVALAFLGGQTSGILSTVGSSIGAPIGGYGQEYEGDESAEDAGEDDGTDGEADEGDGSSDEFGDGVNPGRTVTAAPRDGLLIIKTGNLTLKVGEIAPAVAAASNAIDALGGYVSGSDRSGTGRDAVATVTFRVPSAQWESALAAIQALAIEVLLEHSTTQDVTSQVVDLQARIRNLQVTEQALQAIMDQAAVIKDVLTIQAELTVTRGRIEQLTAERAHLEEQAAYSTLAVTFVLEPAPVLVEQQAGFDPTTEVDAASASLVGFLQSLATAGIWFGIVWLPVLGGMLLVGGVLFLVARRARSRAVPA